MKVQIARIAVLLLLAVIGGGQLAMSQVRTGTPPFNSYGGGPFDTVNLGNLNVHFTIPILHKAGRGIPFSFDLTYDSSVWKQVLVGATEQWTPVFANWGWNQRGRGGKITFSVGTSDCQYYVSYTGEWYTAYTQYFYNNWIYTDDAGVPHTLDAGTTTNWSGGTVPGTNCASAPVTVSTASGSTYDGYTISITNYTHGVVTSPGGMKVDSYGGTTFTDTNGNKITSNGSGQFFDTLSSTTPVLTALGWDFKYAAPAGDAHIIATFKTYTVKTNFGVTSPYIITEYGPQAVSLIDQIHLPDGSAYTFTYETTPGSCTPLANTQPNCVTARIATVTLPTGGQIAYTYTGGSNGILVDGSAAGLTRTLTPGGTWTYTRSAGTYPNWTTTITSPPDPANNDSSNVTVLNFLDSSEYEIQRNVYQGSASPSNLLLTTTMCYNNPASCPNSSVSSPITKVDARIQYPNGGLQGRTVTTYTSSGLVTKVDKYMYSSSSNLPTTIGESTTISYATLGNGITNRPSGVWVSDPAGTLSNTSYFYDEYGLNTTTGTPQQVAITGARGNLTTIGYAVFSKHFHYYDTGTPASSIDANGATTTYLYDSGSCGNSFPTEIDLPIAGLRTYATWNCSGSVQLTSKDVNGKTTTTDYSDANFWRPDWVQDPALNKTQFAYYGNRASESYLLFNGPNSISEQALIVDEFGRPRVRQQQLAPGGSSQFNSVKTDYDALGRPYQTTMPYVGDFQQTTSSAPVTKTTYDALGHVTRTEDDAGGYVKYTYNQNIVVREIGPPAPGESTKKKQLEYDALGRLISVCEVATGSSACGQAAAPANGYVTTYSYDHTVDNGQIVLRTQVTQGEQTRTYLRDLVGRLVKETNPENGVTSYTFDSASGCSGSYIGDLVKKVDAKQNVTCYSYDPLHRLTDVSTSGPYAAECKRFRYDNTTGVLGTIPSGVSVVNTLGRLVEAETDNCTLPITPITDLWFSYSPRGEVASTWQSTPHSGGYYKASAEYWAHGALWKLMSNITGLPDVSYGVDAAGRPSTVTATSH